MKRLLLAAVLVPAGAAPAAAFNLGCWNASSISENPGSPDGTYLNSASSVDYIAADNEGVGLLMASLGEYAGGDYVICLAGRSGNDDGVDHWEVSAAIICPSSHFNGEVCPE